MSSSSSQDDYRRLQRAAGTRQLTRRNSSFFSSVKNYVPKPLVRLFSGSEEFDDSKDETGKRRRLDGQQNEPVDGIDDSPAPKRLRLRSPDRAASQPPPHTANGYLDPPSSAFQPFFHSSYLSNDPSNPVPCPSIPLGIQSLGAFLGTATMQSVVLPPLHSVAARDMSMEPAQGSFLRSSGSQIRDTSLPLGFRVRTSVTPQPVRDTSEPPTISSLGSKPVFVRGPTAEASKPQTTLGSLVDTQRRLTSVKGSYQKNVFFNLLNKFWIGPRPPTAAERTLHELDIYRTPLKPSRLRENSALASSPGGATDMFSRKKSYQRMPGGRTAKAKVANQTKPYAGDAGIKKHLARSRKASVEEEVVPSKGELNDDDVSMNEGRPLSDILPEINKDRKESKLPDNQPKTSKAAEKQSTMPSSSSLRVGRTFTSRNHIDRPSRSGRKGFSAVYDDGEDEEREEESKKERKMMEEAAKHVPIFSIPVGFSFAKDADKPQDVVASDLSKAKEPPIPSLPFSISSFQSGTSSVSSAASVPPSNGSEQASAAASPFTPPAPEIPATVDVPASSTAEALPKTNGGIPNFFASSKTVAQTPLVVAPMTLTATGASAPASLPFSITPPQPPPPATRTPSAPVHDVDNPLWNGVKKDDNAGKAQNETLTPSPAVNGGGGIFAFGGSGTTKSFPLFGSAKQDGPHTSIPAENTKRSSFSFGSPAPESPSVADSTPPPPLFSIAPAKTAEPDQAQKPLTLTFNNNAGKESTSPSAFSFGQTPNNSAEPKTNGFFAKQIEAVDSAPKPSTASAFTFAGSPAPAAPTTPAISFDGTLSNKETTAPQSPFSLGSAPAHVPGAGGNNTAFTFGPPSASTDKAESASKPPFSFGPAPTAAKDSGAANPLSFAFGSGSSEKKNESSSSSMFGFGATPSTPPISDADKKPSFGFTTASTSAPATSFFGGGSTSDGSKSFSFGAAAMNPRPVTPPNQDQEIKMDESPTRDMQITNGPKIAEPRPTLGVFPSFNNTSGGSSFGQSGGSMTPSFAFGGAPTSSNPFAKENKPEENKGFGSFGQSSGTSSSFPFTRKTSEDPPRPSTAGAFSFQSPNSATGSGSGSGFGFGGASSGTTSTFPSGPLSAPNSPSTFNNPSPSFTFAAAPAPATTNPFTFGSQPASPATGSTNLPSVASTSFGGGFAGQSNPFGAASTTPAAPSSGGTLFTIGAAPSAPPNGMRQIKKLPNRRGAKR
ncbi:hypothetical protein EDD18DRAFT_1135604 [Armillaria luteobubalina]|uniref:Uncharacterized protein n=1 Tax=Armillaria luteobubalina TaxID=153913 RepID=A0AA39QIC3_9AGAR|nr:hypothetical protein EDD18DRAFT_1135604 [Armillaria luteobubalina]